MYWAVTVMVTGVPAVVLPAELLTTKATLGACGASETPPNP